MRKNHVLFDEMNVEIEFIDGHIMVAIKAIRLSTKSTRTDDPLRNLITVMNGRGETGRHESPRRVSAKAFKLNGVGNATEVMDLESKSQQRARNRLPSAQIDHSKTPLKVATPCPPKMLT
jgi:hypothetical protein